MMKSPAIQVRLVAMIEAFFVGTIQIVNVFADVFASCFSHSSRFLYTVPIDNPYSFTVKYLRHLLTSGFQLKTDTFNDK